MNIIAIIKSQKEQRQNKTPLMIIPFNDVVAAMPRFARPTITQIREMLEESIVFGMPINASYMHRGVGKTSSLMLYCLRNPSNDLVVVLPTQELKKRFIKNHVPKESLFTLQEVLNGALRGRRIKTILFDEITKEYYNRIAREIIGTDISCGGYITQLEGFINGNKQQKIR